MRTRRFFYLIPFLFVVIAVFTLDSFGFKSPASTISNTPSSYSSYFGFLSLAPVNIEKFLNKEIPAAITSTCASPKGIERIEITNLDHRSIVSVEVIWHVELADRPGAIILTPERRDFVLDTPIQYDVSKTLDLKISFEEISQMVYEQKIRPRKNTIIDLRIVLNLGKINYENGESASNPLLDALHNLIPSHLSPSIVSSTIIAVEKSKEMLTASDACAPESGLCPRQCRFQDGGYHCIQDFLGPNRRCWVESTFGWCCEPLDPFCGESNPACHPPCCDNSGPPWNGGCP